MATQTIRFVAPAGLTLLARLYPVGSGTAFAVEASCTEAARGGVYTFTQSGSSGKYEVHVRDTTGGGDSKLGVIYVQTTDTAATFDCVDQRVDLEIAEDAATAAAGGGGGGGGEVTGFSAAALAQLAGVEISLASTTQTDNSSLDLVQGCDYSADDGTAILWTLTDTADLTGASATLTLKRGATSETFTGTVTETATNTWQLAVELTATETAALATANDWSYSLTLTLANSHVRIVRLPGHRARVLAR